MTSPALTAVEKLRRLVPVLEAGDAEARWLAECLCNYFDGAERGLTADMALDLSPMPGAAAWWTAEAIEARDAALRDLATLFWPGRKVASQAFQIARLASRYATAAWRFDRDRPEMPARYVGTEAEHLWMAFKSGATMPLGKRQLQAVLAVNKRADAA